MPCLATRTSSATQARRKASMKLGTIFFALRLVPASLVQVMRCVRTVNIRLSIGGLILRWHLQMNEPFCRPFGNRRLMHCLNSTSASSQQGGTTIPEVPAWESCGRIISKERADFYEFVACNVLFALVALAILFFRERRLRLGRARMLAARIGIGGGAGTARR